ncbi:hypothetical protein [Aquisalinus flavus]|uniref:Cleaved adhesin domain-containing protein n=1 Tax=Aquisalinus flavus TaxID=1526572 RepID=A0A8J2Y7N8_9PROT|nr:hypothetical protein [Aquisalinus flavus]MBD0425308.1 hypothetical protein [Aquisalinus flavus]UNE49039.1 hypothetical protein FF099_13755 [Aquisalinus flavus]GGD17099.1 hypothetical protein GCM10011342_27360 [Aquisalinus flavus]
MRFFRTLSALLAAGMMSVAGIAASAQVEGEDEASINEAFAAIMASMPRDGDLIMVPWASALGTNGVESADLIDDLDVPGHKALRVTATKKANNWDANVISPIGPAVEKGDLLVVVYYAKLVEGDAQLPYNVVQMNDAPYTSVIQSSDTLNDEWNVYIIQGKAAKAYGQNTLNLQFHLGNADHTVDFGPVFMLNLGK